MSEKNKENYFYRIGVNGFENPLRDPKTEEFKKQIGTGCKLKMDDTGTDSVFP